MNNNYFDTSDVHVSITSIWKYTNYI